MASTAGPEYLRGEIYDTPEQIQCKVKRLAKYVRSSKHMIAFTGAGVSTSAGIPDFRSGVDTSLKTGAGAWVLRDSTPEVRQANASKRVATTTTKAVPTPTHMSLVKLHDEGKGPLKALVSQNTDGLHRRSGMPPSALAELHGNSNLERCVECGWEVMRDYKTRNRKTAPKALQHRTGRKCAVCGGDLHDTIINFGESLPDRDLDMAFDHAERADLCLALGSSLSVAPAYHVPESVGAKQGGKLVIVNLMRTPLHERADLVIHAQCDTVMEMLMQELALDIPTFKLRRRFQIGAALEPSAPATPVGSGSAVKASSATNTAGQLRVWVRGLSPCASGSGDDVPFQFVRRLVVPEVGEGIGATGRAVLGGWKAVKGTKYTKPKSKNGVPRPYAEVLQESLDEGHGVDEGELEVRLTHPPLVPQPPVAVPIRVKLHFFGNYNEPPLELVVNAGEVRQHDICFEPGKRAPADEAVAANSTTVGAAARVPGKGRNKPSAAAHDAVVGCSTWVHERVTVGGSLGAGGSNVAAGAAAAAPAPAASDSPLDEPGVPAMPDIGGILASVGVLKTDAEYNIEVTDDDMNNPELIAQLAELGGDNPEPAAEEGGPATG